jgi:hypothetical protein
MNNNKKFLPKGTFDYNPEYTKAFKSIVSKSEEIIEKNTVLIISCYLLSKIII